MMNIYIDGRMIDWTGIGTYIQNVLKRLPEVGSTYRFTAIANPGEEENLPNGIGRSVLKARIPVYSLKEQIHLKSSFRKADLVHFPHFSAPLAFNRPYVVTIHDLVYFLFRSACPHKVGHLYARVMYPRIARRAHLIITDSAFSKREIIKYLSIPKERVRTIYLGVDTKCFHPQPSEVIEPILQKYGIWKKYLLYVGNHQRRKNIPRLIQAFAQLKKRQDYQLVIGGPNDARLTEIQNSLQTSCSKDEVILTGRIPLEELPALYSGASCFIFPSLYEGFGLPLLESMACGTPVVASNTSSLPEVVGDAGVLVEPHESLSLREGIERILNNKGLQEELRERGMERARKFSWDTTVKETLQVYHDALA
jgi:glycosyltransferase involved in cell wall biosynthesis